MNTVRHVLLAAPIVLLLTACTSTEPNAMHRISVSAAIASAGARPAPGVNADLIVGGEGGSVSISSAQMVLSRLKLANNEACAADSDDVNEPDDSTEVDDSTEMDGSIAAVATHHEPNDDNEGEHHDGDGHDDDGCPPLKVGPVLVDLPLDGTTKVILDALVPAGTYTRLQARLHAVDADDQGVSDFLAAHPEFEGISVKVVGVFTDTGGMAHDFTFVSHINAVSMIKFATPVTVDAGTTNLTINVDVSSWFTAMSGAVIDPTNSANQRRIEKNIRASLRACKDNNHDGDDDHDEEGHH